MISIRIFSFVGSQAGEKSRTARFSDRVARKLKQRFPEPVEYERLTGADISLDFCLSCQSCFRTGECPADTGDDLPLLKQKMLAADILFFCSPVYTGSMSATAKAVFDRLAYWTHRAEIAGKTAAVLVTTSNNHGKETVAEIADTLRHMGASIAYAGFVSTHDQPNLYLEEDMEPETDKICDAILDCYRDPVKYITPGQDNTFAYLSQIYRRQKRFDDRFGLTSSAEVRIAAERGFTDCRSLREYVKALREQEGAGEPTV